MNKALEAALLRRASKGSDQAAIAYALLQIARALPRLASQDRKSAVQSGNNRQPRSDKKKIKPAVSATPRDKATYSVQEFCMMFDISRATFYNEVNRGTGPRIMKVGTRTLISAEALHDFKIAHEGKEFS